MSNTRDSARVPVPGQVTGEVTVYEPMTILDLSDRGAQVETKFPLHLDSLHEFRLSLGTRSVVVKGRIAHCQIGELGEIVRYRSGIEFIEPTEHALAAIHAFVEALKFAASAPPGILDAELSE
jgi:PilZ domain-containing protein